MDLLFIFMWGEGGFFKKVYLCIFRETARWRGVEGERASPADSALSVEPDMGLDHTTLRS